MILPIRLYGDPVLRTKARNVSDFSTMPELMADMFETMYNAKGVGLAGPQVGLSSRVFTWVDYADEEPEGETEPRSRILNEYFMVNPTLEFLDKTLVEGLEGCLSIPEIYEEGVPRKRALRVNYQNEHGIHKSLEVEDYNARIVQHEFDHLEAKLFLDYLPSEVVATHRSDLVRMQREAKEFLKGLRVPEKAAQKPRRA
jgi:peptide deformylase